MELMLFGIAVGIIIGLIIGVYLGAQIIDEKNRELKYLRKELAKAAGVDVPTAVVTIVKSA